MTDKIVFY